jgi:hypothetical protein
MVVSIILESSDQKTFVFLVLVVFFVVFSQIRPQVVR